MSRYGKKGREPVRTISFVYVKKISKVKSIKDRILSDREKANTGSADDCQYENIADMIAAELGLKSATISKMIGYANYLDNDALERLSTGRAPRKFFETIDIDKIKMAKDLMIDGVPMVDIVDQVSRFVIELFAVYEGHGGVIPEECRYVTDVYTSDLRYAEQVILNGDADGSCYTPPPIKPLGEAQSGIILKSFLVKIRNDLDALIAADDAYPAFDEKIKKLAFDAVKSYVEVGG